MTETKEIIKTIETCTSAVDEILNKVIRADDCYDAVLTTLIAYTNTDFHACEIKGTYCFILEKHMILDDDESLGIVNCDIDSMWTQETIKCVLLKELQTLLKKFLDVKTLNEIVGFDIRIVKLPYDCAQDFKLRDSNRKNIAKNKIDDNTHILSITNQTNNDFVNKIIKILYTDLHN